jgi:SMI1 / KNR4 family (SUKH-1)
MNISELEQRLKLTLPPEYRQLLADYPPRLAAIDYFDDPAQGGPRNFELLNSPRELLNLNRRERARWHKSDHAHVSLPDCYFFIGWDGCGNLFAIDVSDKGSCPVLEFDHELQRWSQISHSLAEFIDHLESIAGQLRPND